MLNLKFSQKVQAVQTKNSKSKYNELKDNYYKKVRHIINKLKELPQEAFDNDVFSKLILIVDDLPPLNPIDPKVALSIRLIKDYFYSFSPLKDIHQHNLDNNHYQRFILLLERVESYLQLSQETTFKPRLSTYTNQLTLSQSGETTIDSNILDEIDETILDNNLYDFICNKLDYAYTNNLINDKENDLIKKTLEPELFQKYEQLPDFDFDEICNSINNSIKTNEWFLRNDKEISDDAKHDLLCCFLKKVEKIDKNIIPLTHDFYALIDEEDKHSLINILHQIIELNNYYTGTHIKLSLTFSSHNLLVHQLKSNLFDFAEHLGEKYFYGRFFDDIISAEVATEKFLSAFNKLISEIFEPYTQKSFCYGIVFLFSDAVFWFVLLNSVYGGIPIFNNKNFDVQIYSQKSQVNRFLPYQHMIQSFYGNAPILCKQLMNEYETTFFLGNIDLRFKKNILRSNSYQEFKSKLNSISTDLREMRRLLIKNYNPINSIIELDLQLSETEQITLGGTSNKLYALWQWETYGDGLGRICLGFDKDEMIEQALKPYRKDAKYKQVLRVNWDGKISPLETPWVTTDKMSLLGYDCPIDFNFHIMHKFHELFYNWYANTAQKIKSKKVTLSINNELKDDTLIFDEIDESNIIINETLNQFLVSDDYSFNDNTKPLENKKNTQYFNQGIKSTKFFKILEENFNITIKQGKGSEMKAIKEGGKIYRLGHHGKEVVYHANLIRKVLRRLEIELNDWLKVMNGSIVV